MGIISQPFYLDVVQKFTVIFRCLGKKFDAGNKSVNIIEPGFRFRGANFYKLIIELVTCGPELR